MSRDKPEKESELCGFCPPVRSCGYGPTSTTVFRVVGDVKRVLNSNNFGCGDWWVDIELLLCGVGGGLWEKDLRI